MKLLLLVSGPITLAAAPAFGQGLSGEAPWQTAAGSKMAFGVASIHTSKPGKHTPPNFPLIGDGYNPTGGRFLADFPLTTYIKFAYKLGLTPGQTESMVANLPNWVATDRFTFQARAPLSNPTKDQMRLMMQSLLADRFQLVVHFEMPTVPTFALMLAKPGKLGPRLRPHDEGPACDQASDKAVFPPRCETYSLERRAGGMRIAGSRNTTLESLAGAIPTFGSVSRPVVDQTGLTGRFDFTLEWMPESSNAAAPNGGVPPEPAGPTFFQALHEQLGLKLESMKAPVRILIIDHIESPSEN